MKTKTILLSILVVNLFLANANVAFAQRSDVYDYEAEAGVGQTIRDYLCAPTEPDRNSQNYTAGSEIYFGSSAEDDIAARNAGSQDLYICINRLYRFALVFASVLAVAFIVFAGYIYMSSEGNQESVDKAKSILTTSIAALVILFIGFILLRAINPDLVEFNTIQPPSVDLERINVSEFLGAGGFDPDSRVGEPAGEGGTCREPQKDYKVANNLGASSCFNNNCNSYNTFVQNAASSISIPGINEEALIKAVMFRESSCNATARSGVGSCGLMQLQPSTAEQLKSVCEVPSSTVVDCDWLTANPEKNICMGAKYLEQLSKTACGSNVAHLAAGYNGGSKACNASRDCTGNLRAWECLYDNTEHTICNTGYTETRRYAPNVYGCYNYYGG